MGSYVSPSHTHTHSLLPNLNINFLFCFVFVYFKSFFRYLFVSFTPGFLLFVVLHSMVMCMYNKGKTHSIDRVKVLGGKEWEGEKKIIRMK